MKINFEKYPNGLVPAIVQDSSTRCVLMLGFMNAESLAKTKELRRVTFYSRSRQELWTKGATTGNLLWVDEILTDCDNDTLLIKASPDGPTCHVGWDTCFKEENTSVEFLRELEQIILDRRVTPVEGSYTSSLFAAGLNRIAQKVGEEAVELIIEAKDSDDELFKAEAADLLYHLLVLLAEKGVRISEVVGTLQQRRLGELRTK